MHGTKIHIHSFIKAYKNAHQCILKNPIFWDITVCSLLNVFSCFGDERGVISPENSILQRQWHMDLKSHIKIFYSNNEFYQWTQQDHIDENLVIKKDVNVSHKSAKSTQELHTHSCMDYTFQYCLQFSNGNIRRKMCSKTTK